MKYYIQNNIEYRVSPAKPSLIKELWTLFCRIIRKFISTGGSGGVYL